MGDLSLFGDINPDLLEMARQASMGVSVQGHLMKSAVTMPGMDGGASVPDPAMAAAGGAPPPGMPGDPSQMGGAAPMPGMPPPAPPAPVDPSQQVQAPAQGVPPKKSGNAEMKTSIDSLRAEVYQLRQLLVSFLKASGFPIPDEAILGPQPPTPPQDPNTAPSPAVAGAGAMTDPAMAPPGGAPPGAGAPPPPADPSAAMKTARDSLLALFDDADDNDGTDEADDADGFLQAYGRSKHAGSRLPVAPLTNEAPEQMGTVLAASALGPLHSQPVLLAAAARSAAARLANGGKR